MNGPAHYREAERMLIRASDANVDDAYSTYLITAAQVHATLAQAAAFAEAGGLVRIDVSDAGRDSEWAKAVTS